jgi:hypothetical protein
MTCTINYNDNKSKLYERLYNYDSETADYYYSLITDLYKKQPFIELSLITKDLMNNDSYYNPLIIDKLGDFKTFRKELINNRYKYTLDESSSNVEDLYVLPVNVITTNPQLNHLYQLDKSNKVFYSNYDLSVPLINNRTKLFEQSTNINDFSIHNGVFHIGYNQLSKLNRLYPNLDRKSLLVEYLYNHNKE